MTTAMQTLDKVLRTDGLSVWSPEGGGCNANNVIISQGDVDNMFSGSGFIIAQNGVETCLSDEGSAIIHI